MTATGGGDTGRDAALDGLRGLAALAILVFHAWLFTQPDPDSRRRDGPGDHLLHELRLSVFLFFALTGFLLWRRWVAAARGRAPAPDLRDYARRRAARILPAYWLAIAGSVALMWPARGTPGVELPAAADLWRFVVLAQNHASDTLLTLNGPTWTLAVEAAFYVLLPLAGAAALALPRGRGAAVAVPAALLLVGLAWNAWLVHAGLGGPWSFALPAMLPYFAAGMLAAALLDGRRPGRPAARALVLAGLALVVADGVWQERTATTDLTRVVRDVPAGLGFGLVVAGVAAAARGPLAHPLAAGLGRISYGVYLWHVPVLLALRAAGLLPLSLAGGLLVALPPVLALGWASWRWVEAPALRRAGGGRDGEPRKVRAPPPGPAGRSSYTGRTS